MSHPTYTLVAVARTPQATIGPTFSEVGPLRFDSASYTDELNRAGSLASGIAPSAIPSEIRTRLLDLRRFPTELWMYRNSALVWAGPLVGWQIQGGDSPTVTLNAGGLLYYTRYMRIGPDTGDLIYPTGTEQFVIARGLVDAWQTLEYGHFGIDTGAHDVASGIGRERTYLAEEQPDVHGLLENLGAVADGFDHWIEPDTRNFRLAHPARGVDATDVVIFDQRNIGETDVVGSVAAGDVASEGYGLATSADPNVEPLTSVQSDLDVRQTFGRTAVGSTYDGVTEQATLDQHTAAMVAVRDEAYVVPASKMIPVAEADVDDFNVGDTITYDFDAGIGRQTINRRIAKRTVSVSRDGAEDMEVAFV